MKKEETIFKKQWLIAFFTMLLLACIGGWYLINSHLYSGPPESIIVSTPPLEESAFIYIAKEKGFFTRNGLDVTIRDDYPDGVAPISDMLEGKTDIAVSAEYPVITQVFNKEKISIFGCIDKFQHVIIISQRDHGINQVSDLKGKKIGLPRGTIGEFFLGRFLNLNGISLNDVTLVDVKVPQAMDAITSGDIDAMLTNRPSALGIINQLGDNGVSWLAQSDQMMYAVVVAKTDWIASHPQTVERFLKSIAKAEDYLMKNPDESKAIVQKSLKRSDAILASEWPNHEFSLSLDQSLLMAMDEEGRWAIKNNLVSEKVLPNFSNCIYTKGMEDVKPEAVDIR